MTKEQHSTTAPNPYRKILFSTFIFMGLFALGLSIAWLTFENYYTGKIYPNVSISGVNFGGKTPQDVQLYWEKQNIPFADAVFEFRFEQHLATISGETLNLGYDATLSATQAYAVGRSGHIFTDIRQKFFKKTVELSPYFRWKTDNIDETLSNLSANIDIPVEDALFQFNDGRVTAFRPSHNGRRLNIDTTKKRFEEAVSSLPYAPSYYLVINLPVETVVPTVTTDKVNSFGIKELIGRGYSEFHGSIPGRIHNVELAASRINGVLIAPGETLSFVNTIGDISAATGYQSAYIIKDGRTVLGDGGGVCQVSTTLFRAALDAGLPIPDRHAHAYRVHYYEEAGYKAGIDATVFSPSVDLKITNDTPTHILIQTKTDTKNLSLTFELYGTRDGRIAEIYNHVVGGEIPPPPALYQDDPTLAPGVVRQVDFSAWGARASFGYRVKRAGQVLQDTTFTSVYRPWQAVFLKGPQI
ncbi:VanW family protein [Candidatus Woesebacteria bacterium]|nr:VanW family protein [Candidatus Woesebacteria bacterium]